MAAMMYLSPDYIDSLPNLQESSGHFDTSDLPDDPNRLFAKWFTNAVDNGVIDARAVTVATVDTEGRPDARTVDLAFLDSNGFHFGTAADTAKVRQMEKNTGAALNFWWQPVRRAVRVRGNTRRKVDGDRFNLWCIEPDQFEFFQLAADRLNSERVAYFRDEAGEWQHREI